MYSRWFAAKAGVVALDSLEFVRTVRDDHGEWNHYACPCGGDSHYASLPSIVEGLSKHLGDVLTCYETGRQWLVSRASAVTVILDEERRYIDLLARSAGIVNKVVKRRGWSEATIAFLKDTHGIDREVAEGVVA